MFGDPRFNEDNVELWRRHAFQTSLVTPVLAVTPIGSRVVPAGEDIAT
jgi:hypothetical protein